MTQAWPILKAECIGIGPVNFTGMGEGMILQIEVRGCYQKEEVKGTQ